MKYKDFDITVSMGIASSEDCKQREYDTLFQMGDKALHTAKHNGGNTYYFYNEEIEAVWETKFSQQ